MQFHPLSIGDLDTEVADPDHLWRPPALVPFLNLVILVGLLLLSSATDQAARNCCELTNENQEAFLGAAETIVRELITMSPPSGPVCVQLQNGQRPIETSNDFYQGFNDLKSSLHRGVDCQMSITGAIVLRSNGQSAVRLAITRMHVDKPGVAEAEGSITYGNEGGQGWDFHLKRQSNDWRSIVQTIPRWLS